MHNLLQKIQNPCWRAVLIIQLVVPERELADGQLHDAQPKTPHITLNGVLFTLYAFRSHVCRCADKSIRNGVDELARNTEIAELDAALRVHKNVGGLDVAVHDVVFGIEVRQAAEGGFCDFAKHVDANRAKDAGDAVKGAVVC